MQWNRVIMAEHASARHTAMIFRVFLLVATTGRIGRDVFGEFAREKSAISSLYLLPFLRKKYLRRVAVQNNSPCVTYISYII